MPCMWPAPFLVAGEYLLICLLDQVRALLALVRFDAIEPGKSRWLPITAAVQGRTAGTEDGHELLFGAVRQRTGPDGVHRLLNGICDPLAIDRVALDDCKGGPRIAVARLADAARVDDQLFAHLQNVW